MTKRKRAKLLMQSYIHMLMLRAGMYWDDDNVAEIDELVDCIIDAAIEEMTAPPAPGNLARFGRVGFDDIYDVVDHK